VAKQRGEVAIVDQFAAGRTRPQMFAVVFHEHAKGDGIAFHEFAPMRNRNRVRC